MENEQSREIYFKEENDADSYDLRMYRSNLFQAAKNAQKIFDYLGEGVELEEWMKQHIVSASEELNQVRQALEYNREYPERAESLPSEEEVENNYLSNEDKRYPMPQESESSEQFMTRCIYDANMKKRYPEQGDRFMACMLILNGPNKSDTDNPGEKFEDPMDPTKKDTPLDPQKPILP